MPIVRLARRCLVSATLVVLACAGSSHADLAVGQPAPGFTLTDLDGNTVSLVDQRGKTVVLEWINPNCPFSRRHSAEKTMQSLADAHPDVVWLGINSTNPSHGDHLTPAEHKAFLDEHGVAYPVLEDPSGDVGRAYGAKTTPQMYIIDGDGLLVYNGAIDDSPRGSAKVNYVASALAALAAGREPSPAATKPYGCTVKY